MSKNWAWATWPIRGVRVVDDTVVISMKGGNADARALCGDLLAPTAPRTLLEQHDLDQSTEYRKGYEDGRHKGYEVGHRHATEAAARQSATSEAAALADILQSNIGGTRNFSGLDDDQKALWDRCQRVIDADVAPMSQPNQLTAYAACQKLRDLGYVWDGESWAQTSPVAPADYLDGINVQRLTDALVWLGVATDAPEFMAARMAEYVNAITSAVIRHKALFRAAPPSFQARVHPWVLDCFGAEVAADVPIRNYRFLEEAVELVQACGCDEDDAHKLVDYVFGRPVGEPSQEVGGVMVTLAALCLANGLDMHEAADVELARISTPELIAKIRAKQATKPHNSPLPGAGHV